jgi:hypothetical protein
MEGGRWTYLRCRGAQWRGLEPAAGGRRPAAGGQRGPGPVPVPAAEARMRLAVRCLLL